MDFLPKNAILERKPDTLEYVRSVFNLEKPGVMKDAVNILNEWIQKQPHFNKKDFRPFYLETTILGCKGSIERSKMQIDKICTMRTLLPQFFGSYNPKTDFEHLYEVVNSLMLPKLTEDHQRVFVCQFHDVEWEASQGIYFYRHNISLAEYAKVHDYLSGFVMIIDFSQANLMDFVMKMNLVHLRQAMTIYIEGYGMRIKAIHLITPSKFVDTLLSILKQVLSSKVAGRINIHKTYEELHKYLPKEILPEDFGGEERSLKKLQDEFTEVLSSEEHLNYLREMDSATTNEEFRQKDKFSEQYAGMPGTFRLLSVD
ncbi:alpha-tocopherol transfer protein-like [Bicyclus anynana]|uniref:Alpha-tocopherol transfer protein-like n=1 Tax=Bicyclus anynana TaxID=110368 RepID=A0ABM3LJL5_BICAN|nr:alpha-tocopherol transfer protein-like [Bicyclus anynana]